MTEYQASLLEKQLIDSENESQSYDSQEEGLETEMDQEDIYVTPKASSVKNGKSSSTMQKQVASQGQEKEILQDHLVSQSGKKTAQRGPSERVSMQLATKESLQAVTPTPAQNTQKQRQTAKDLSFILLDRMEELVAEVKDLRKRSHLPKKYHQRISTSAVRKRKTANRGNRNNGRQTSFIVRFNPYSTPHVS